MLKLEVAAELRGLAKELEQIQRLEPAATSRWRVGVVLGVPKLAKVARRTCAAWAWIVRQGLTSGNYAGFVLPRKDERENQRFANLPHYRLREFVKWATTLPRAKGLPHDTRGTYGNSGDNWIWAINTVADWLDNVPDKPEPVTKPMARLVPPPTTPPEILGCVRQKLDSLLEITNHGTIAQAGISGEQYLQSRYDVIVEWASRIRRYLASLRLTGYNVPARWNEWLPRPCQQGTIFPTNPPTYLWRLANNDDVLDFLVDVELAIRALGKPADTGNGEQTATPKQLNKTDKKIAKYIRENPGCKGDSAALDNAVTPEHFRSRIVPKLKTHGFYNEGEGYFPPKRGKAKQRA